MDVTCWASGLLNRMNVVTEMEILSEHQGGNGEKMNLSLRLLRLGCLKTWEFREQFYLTHAIGKLGNLN